MFKLKSNQESFRVIHGPFAGRQFLRGVTYAEVPSEEKHKFEDLSHAEPQSPQRKDSKVLKTNTPTLQHSITPDSGGDQS